MGQQEDDQKPAAKEAMETDDADEDAVMQMALQMSMQPETTDEAKEESKQESGSSQQQFQDPRFVNELLGSLPGVDPNDPAIQNALRNLGDDKKDEGGKDGEKKE